jgi:hypothetical protein
MITNFESQTYELTAEELQLLPILIAGFRRHDETDPIKAADIVTQMTIYLENKGITTGFTEPRLRKFVNYIRSNGILPLIATSQGYFVSDDMDRVRTQVLSLQQRARSILICADGLENYIRLQEGY